MRAKDLINKLSKEAIELPDIIAPVLVPKSSVRVVVNNHPYRLYIETPHAGWYLLKPTSSIRAEVIREAEPFEIQECLKLSSSLRTIVMRRINESRWLVFPFNLSDAQSKHFPASPLEVFMVDQNLEPFSVVMTRLWGSNLLYDSYIEPPNECLSEDLEQGKDELRPIPGINPEFKLVYSMLTDEIEKAKRSTIEGQIKSAVEYLGAELVGFKESGDGYSVEFKDGNRTHRTIISGGLRLVSAGICLNRANHQTLTSAVAVLRKSDEIGHHIPDYGYPGDEFEEDDDDDY